MKKVGIIICAALFVGALVGCTSQTGDNALYETDIYSPDKSKSQCTGCGGNG